MDLPRGVQRVEKRLRDGSLVVYYYWRGPPRIRLPDIADPVFEAALSKAKATPSTGSKAGTFGALVIDYKRSPNFRGLQPKVQKAYDRALERLRDMESLPVMDIKRAHILKLRDALALEFPQAANQMMQVLSVLMQFAVEREWRESNPCARIRRIKGGEHKRWPETAIAYALKQFPETFRRAVILGLYTGQREGDCVAMRWDQYDGTAVEVVPEKTKHSTKVKLWIPVHKALKRELDRWKAEATAETILTNSYGRPWRGTSFSTRFSKLIGKHPMLEGYVFHGLRKAAAARLAEAGCSTHEIASITGHASLDMIEHYTKEADQKRRAVSAITKLELVSETPQKPSENREPRK